MAESEISASTRATCVRIHRETSAFYAQHKAACGLHGFETLYGPPIDKPDLMFVGYQPGGVGGANEIGNIDHAPWPSECLYRTATWHLARRLRETFGPLLERSTGLNAIFVRSPNIATYNREVSHAMRRIIADFCLPRAIEIIDATAPEQVVAIGFETLRAFGRPNPGRSPIRGEGSAADHRQQDRRP